VFGGPQKICPLNRKIFFTPVFFSVQFPMHRCKPFEDRSRNKRDFAVSKQVIGADNSSKCVKRTEFITNEKSLKRAGPNFEQPSRENYSVDLNNFFTELYRILIPIQRFIARIDPTGNDVTRLYAESNKSVAKIARPLAGDRTGNSFPSTRES